MTTKEPDADTSDDQELAELSDSDESWDDDAVAMRSRVGPLMTTPALAIAGLALAILSMVFTSLDQLLVAAGQDRFETFAAPAGIVTGFHGLLALLGGGLGFSALWINDDSPRWADAAARAAVILAIVFVIVIALTFTASVLLQGSGSPGPAGY